MSFIGSVKVNFDEHLTYIIFFLLIVSAISRLDSTLSNAAKLIVLDLSLLSKTILNGRLVMFIFSILGLIFIFFNTKDLYTAVGVSGTAATFLTTTYILRIISNVTVSKVSLIISFVFSICGSMLYYLKAQKINNFLIPHLN